MKNYIEHLQKLERKPKEFWKYFLEHKNDLKLILDNDDTIVIPMHFDDNADEHTYANAPNYIGNSDGMSEFLKALEINFEHC